MALSDYNVNNVSATYLLSPTCGYDTTIGSSNYAKFCDGTYYLPDTSTNFILTSAKPSNLNKFNNLWGKDVSPIVDVYLRGGVKTPSFARKGCCPMTAPKGSYIGSYGDSSCYLYSTDTGYVLYANLYSFWLGFTPGDGLWVAKPGGYAQRVPYSTNSNVVIIDAVGAGGGGGGGMYNKVAVGHWPMAGGGGGESGALMSVVVDLAAAGENLLCKRGTGGDGGSAGLNGNAGAGSNGGDSCVLRADQSTYVCWAAGGYGGNGATTSAAGAASSGHSGTTSIIKLPNVSWAEQHAYSFGAKGGAGASKATSGCTAGSKGGSKSSTVGNFKKAYDGFNSGNGGLGSTTSLTTMRGGGGGGCSSLGHGGYGNYGYVNTSNGYTYVGNDRSPGYGGGGGGGAGSKRSTDDNVSAGGGQKGGDGLIAIYFEKTSSS